MIVFLIRSNFHFINWIWRIWTFIFFTVWFENWDKGWRWSASTLHGLVSNLGLESYWAGGWAFWSVRAHLYFLSKIGNYFYFSSIWSLPSLFFFFFSLTNFIFLIKCWSPHFSFTNSSLRTGWIWFYWHHTSTYERTLNL